MSDLFSAVRQNLNQHLESVWMGNVVNVFTSAHLFFRSFKQFTRFQKAAADPTKGNPAAYGAALHIAGQYTALSAPITIAIIAKCTQDILRESQKVKESYQSLKDALQWSYPLYHSVEWAPDHPGEITFFTPSFLQTWHVTYLAYARQVHKVVCCAFKVLAQLFQLSMCLADAHLLLKGDQATRLEACTELVGEWENYYEELKENKRRLLEFFEGHGDLAGQIVKTLKTSLDIDCIVQGLRKELKEEHPEAKEEAGQAEGWDDFYQAAEITMTSLFNSGKITNLSLQFPDLNSKPIVPPGRFPPWGGQDVSDLVPNVASQKDPAPQSSTFNPLKESFDETVDQISTLASKVKRVVQGPMEVAPSPFA